MDSAATDSAWRWRAAPLLRLSAALHIIAIVVTIVRPHWWPWTLAAVIANHLQLTALGLWPRSRALGSNWTALPAASTTRGEVAITIDDGPDPAVTPQVLAVLKRYDVRATFFCVGALAERHRSCVHECIAAGHAVENHSYRHRHNFSLLGPFAMYREIARAQSALSAVGGAAPRFFRAPAGLRNPFLDPVLQRLQLQLASWTRRGYDTVDGDADAVYARLVRGLKAGDILLLHDGHAARTRSGMPLILEVLPRLLEAIRERSLKPVTLREAAR